MSSGSALVSTMATPEFRGGAPHYGRFALRSVRFTREYRAVLTSRILLEVAPEFASLTIQRSPFLLAHFLVFRRTSSICSMYFNRPMLLRDLEDWSRAAQPALVHVRNGKHAKTVLFASCRLFFAADKQNTTTTDGDLLEEIGCPRSASQFKKG